ncbi:MAG: PEP-CTERM sorting domain-containing protein [Burkholderiales bacterium]|nr:PEP-CTERM sorting domain-containing protein [Burkholderiales bacterium]
MKNHLLLALLSFVSIGANAGTYTDRTTFESAVNIGYKETFQSLNGTVGFTGPITLPTALTVSSPSNNLFSVGAGQSSNPTEAIGSNYPAGDYLSFDLGGNYLAFGADLFQNFGGGSQRSSPVTFALSFFDGATLLSSITTLVAPNGGSFIGFTSDAGAFNRVHVLSQSGGYEVVDNVTVGTVTAVPEPETYALMLAGLGMVGTIVRRRKAQQP